jgi:hypothetical protein
MEEEILQPPADRTLFILNVLSDTQHLSDGIK